MAIETNFGLLNASNLSKPSQSDLTQVVITQSNLGNRLPCMNKVSSTKNGEFTGLFLYLTKLTQGTVFVQTKQCSLKQNKLNCTIQIYL